jgi:hypothetical protein
MKDFIIQNILKKFGDLNGNPAKEDEYLYSTSIVNFYACHDNECFFYFLNQIHYFEEEAFKQLEI